MWSTLLTALATFVALNAALLVHCVSKKKTTPAALPRKRNVPPAPASKKAELPKAPQKPAEEQKKEAQEKSKKDSKSEQSKSAEEPPKETQEKSEKAEPKEEAPKEAPKEENVDTAVPAEEKPPAPPVDKEEKAESKKELKEDKTEKTEEKREKEEPVVEAETSKKAPPVVNEGPKELTTDQKNLTYGTEGGVQKLTLKNTTGHREAIKIKCSDSALYRIEPVFDYIDDGQSLEIEVKRAPGGAAKTDKLVVVHIPAPEDEPADIAELFKKAGKEQKCALVHLNTAL